MPTTETRLNLTLAPEMEVAINQLATRNRISRAGKVTELLRVALEIEEDHLWDKLAGKRDRRGAKFVPHKKA